MAKHRGFCQKCGTTTSSAWEPIKPEWQRFVTLPNVPAGRKKNVFCAACARSLNRREPDPLVELFPKAKRNSDQNLTAPVVSRSSVAGKGLFATRDYAANELVTLYAGQNISRDKVAELEDPSYVMHLYYHTAIDGRIGWEGTHGLGRFINSSPLNERNNVKTAGIVELPSGSKAIKIRTTRKISKGEEFFLAYQSGYFRKMGIKKTDRRQRIRGRPRSVVKRTRKPTAIPEDTKVRRSKTTALLKVTSRSQQK